MHLIIVWVLVAFLVDNSNAASVGDFLRNLPSEVGNAISNTWIQMKKLVIRPVKIKRITGRKNKTTTTPKTVRTYATTVSEKITAGLPTRSPKRTTKLMLPVIPSPTWKSLYEIWSHYDKPTILKRIKEEIGI